MTASAPATSQADTITPEPESLITCGKCGGKVPASESVYVDGGGRMCRGCYPLPEWAYDIDPPW